MLLKGKKAKQLQNGLARKAEHLLFSNFFAPEDFKSMSRRKALKVLKLIAKIEKKSYSKSELQGIYLFIVSDLSVAKISVAVKTYFNFAFIEFTTLVNDCQIALKSLCAMFVFRLSLKKIFRI